MNSLELLQYDTPGPVAGDFRVRNCCLNQARNGYQYLRVLLEDMSCSVPAYIWQEDVYQRFYLPDYSLVQIEGQSQYHNNLLRVGLSRIEPISQKRAGEVVRLLPQSVCPRPELLLSLQSAVNKITIPALHQFVEAILSNDSIAFAFVSAPASLHHHHNYPGGLLQHSLENLWFVESHTGFSKEDRELGLVAALFHDLGKVLTMTGDMQRTSLGSCIDHDKLTFEVLDPYLSQLERNWSEGAKGLRYLLKWKIKREVPQYNIADLVACADRLSAGFAMERQRRQLEEESVVA